MSKQSDPNHQGHAFQLTAMVQLVIVNNDSKQSRGLTTQSDRKNVNNLSRTEILTFFTLLAYVHDSS